MKTHFEYPITLFHIGINELQLYSFDLLIAFLLRQVIYVTLYFQIQPYNSRPIQEEMLKTSLKNPFNQIFCLSLIQLQTSGDMPVKLHRGNNSTIKKQLL